MAVKFVPEKLTAALFSTNVDCCTRKVVPLTTTPWLALPVQRSNQLAVSVMEPAFVARTQPSCSIDRRVSFWSVTTSLLTPRMPIIALSTRDP